MAMQSWLNLPRYQRLIQRIQALRPDQRAILNTSMVDSAFASNEMKNRLQSMAMAADEKYRAKNLDLATRSLDLSKRTADIDYALKKESIDFGRGQERLGSLLSAVSIPVSGYFGYKQMKRDEEEARKNKALMRRYYGEEE